MSFLKKMEINKYDNVKNICIVIMILYPLINLILNRLLQDNNIGSYISYFIYAVCILIALSVSFINETKKMIILMSSFFIVIMFNYCFHFSTFETTINIIAKSFLSCYILFVLVVLCKDRDFLFKSLNIGNYLAIILTSIYILLMKSSKQTLFENGLTIQLVLVILVPVTLVYALKEKRIVDIIFTILGLIEITCFSSRTIIVTIWSLTIFLILVHYIKWFNSSKSTKKKEVSIIIIMITFILLLFSIWNYKVIAEKTYTFLKNHGIYVRILRLLAEDEITNSSGRNEDVYPFMIKKIKTSPILGYGIGMDRIEQQDGTILYAHNIILELFVDFGILIGTFVISTIIFLAVNALKSEYKYFMICFLFSGLTVLMLTSSYTIFRGFWLLLGFLINNYINAINKYKDKNNKILQEKNEI